MGKVLFIVGFNINLLVIKVFIFMGAYLYVFKMVEFINVKKLIRMFKLIIIVWHIKEVEYILPITFIRLQIYY